jgi:iron complex outermembrane receptor protein
MASIQPSVACLMRSTRLVGATLPFMVVPFLMAAAPANLGEIVTFDIPAEPLTTALLEFSTQTRIQVATSGAAVGRAQSPGAVGSMSVRTALVNVLTGTGFVYQVSGDRSVAIVPRP